jgi:hypothetical protein
VLENYPRCIGSGTFPVDGAKENPMMETLGEKMERSPRVSVAQRIHSKPDGSVNGASKLGNGGQNGSFRVPELSIVEGAKLSQVRSGLQFLWKSYLYARELFADPWEFSVEWLELRRLGLTCNEVRWLIRQGLVEHACEITATEDEFRKFVPCSNLTLSKRTCLVLTEEGCRLSQQFAKAQGAEGTATGINPPPSSLASSLPLNDHGAAELIMPQWDRDRRQLRIAAKIIKEFKVPAPNQEMVLGAFEEEHWPPKIDDPLPHRPGIVPQRRLHDTINSLNRRQRHRLLHFSADGLGSGIRWEFLTKRHLRD